MVKKVNQFILRSKKVYEEIYYSDMWKLTHNYRYDWALCELMDKPGEVVGALGAQTYINASELNNLRVGAIRIPSGC